MNKHFFILFAFVLFAASCKTTKASLSVREKSETREQSSARRCSALSSDSILQHFVLDADSMLIFFDATPSGRSIKENQHAKLLSAGKYMPSPDANATDDVYFFSNSKKQTGAPTSALADGAHTAQAKPKALKVYGLHVDKNVNKKSVQQSSLTESNDKSMHSGKYEEDNKTRSSPNSSPKYIFYILLIACAFLIYYSYYKH